MKITKVEVIPLSYPTDDVPPKRRFFAVIKLTTDEGVIGWGEASDCYGHRIAMTVKAYFEEQLQWWLLDQDPLALEPLIARIRAQICRYQGHSEVVIEALSGAEIALWDIRGKVMGKPVCQLLGAYRDRVPLYAAGRSGALHLPPSRHCEWFEPFLSRGVKAVKIRIGKDFAADAAFAREMRALLPPNVRLLVDGKYNYFPDSAIRMSHILAGLGVEGFEEPISDVNLDEMARVAAASPIPIAYGEHCFTIHDFRQLIVRQAARIITPDATVCGGISEALQAARLGLAFGLTVDPHAGGLTAIGLAANLHLAAAIPRIEFFEMDSREYQPLRDQLPTEPQFAVDRIVDGCMLVPTGPGLGVEIDERVFERFPYELDQRAARNFVVYATPHI